MGGFAFTGTDFHGTSHEDLIKMLAPARSENVVASGKRLTDAADKIKAAAMELQTKTGTVQWDGDAATKFREWSSELVSAAYSLEQYTRKTGTELGNAGHQLAQTLAEMPPLRENSIATLHSLEAEPDPAKLIDPATNQPVIDQLRAEVNGDQEEAVQAMNRLAKTYAASWERIVNEPQPQVVRPVDVMSVGFIPPRGELDDDGATVGLTAAAVVGAAAASQTSLSDTPMSANPTPYTAPGPTTGAWPPPQVSGVPGVVTAPGAPLPGTLPPGTNLPGQPPTTGLAQAMGGNPPVSAPGTPGNPALGGSGVGNAPPPMSTGMPTTGSGRLGGLPVSTARGSSNGIIGGQPNSSPRSGPASGRTVSGSSGLRTGAVEGHTTRPGQVGSEPHGTTSGRTGMPMGGGSAASPGGSAAGARNASGRPPIGAPGGVVGGSPGRGAPTGRREFSAGGSGLRSGRPIGGMSGGSSAASDERARRRQRADYLEEDEENWGGQGPGSVPPVIG